MSDHWVVVSRVRLGRPVGFVVASLCWALLGVVGCAESSEDACIRGRRAEYAPIDATRRELMDFMILLDEYALEHPFPSGTVAEVARQLEAAHLTARPSDLPMIWNDRDAWGNRFRLTFDAASGNFRLWSMGPDGIDENGGGDDVLIVGHATRITNR